MKVIGAVLFALVAISPMSQAAELELPYSLDVLAVNGKKVTDKSALGDLPVGKQQIVIRYTDTLKDGSKEKLLSSKAYVLDLDIKQATDSFSLSHKKFRTYRAASVAFDTGNIGWSLKRNGNTLPVQLEILEGSGFMPYVNIEKTVRAYNQKKGIILTSTGTMDITDAVVSVDKKTGKAEISGDPVTQLKLWYTKASKDEQKAFRRWLIDQE
jgi:uncharacterized protein YccT (UPF0319 family)